MQQNAAFHSAGGVFGMFCRPRLHFGVFFLPRLCGQFSDWWLNRCACKIHPHVPSAVTESPAAPEKETCLESGLK